MNLHPPLSNVSPIFGQNVSSGVISISPSHGVVSLTEGFLRSVLGMRNGEMVVVAKETKPESG